MGRKNCSSSMDGNAEEGKERRQSVFDRLYNISLKRNTSKAHLSRDGRAKKSLSELAAKPLPPEKEAVFRRLHDNDIKYRTLRVPLKPSVERRLKYSSTKHLQPIRRTVSLGSKSDSVHDRLYRNEPRREPLSQNDRKKTANTRNIVRRTRSAMQPSWATTNRRQNKNLSFEGNASPRTAETSVSTFDSDDDFVKSDLLRTSTTDSVDLARMAGNVSNTGPACRRRRTRRDRRHDVEAPVAHSPRTAETSVSTFDSDDDFVKSDLLRTSTTDSVDLARMAGNVSNSDPVCRRRRTRRDRRHDVEAPVATIPVVDTNPVAVTHSNQDKSHSEDVLELLLDIDIASVDGNIPGDILGDNETSHESDEQNASAAEEVKNASGLVSDSVPAAYMVDNDDNINRQRTHSDDVMDKLLDIDIESVDDVLDDLLDDQEPISEKDKRIPAENEETVSNTEKDDDFAKPEIFRCSTTDSVDLARMANSVTNDTKPARRGRRRDRSREDAPSAMKSDDDIPSTATPVSEETPLTSSEPNSSRQRAQSEDDFVKSDLVRTSTTDSVDLARMAGGTSAGSQRVPKRRGRRREDLASGKCASAKLGGLVKSELVRTSTTDSVALACMAGASDSHQRVFKRRGRQRDDSVSNDTGPAEEVAEDSTATEADGFVRSDLVRTSTTDSVDLARMAGASTGQHRIPQRRGRRRKESTFDNPGPATDGLEESTATEGDGFVRSDLVRTSTADSVDLARMAGASAVPQRFPKRRGRRREPRQMSLRDIKAEKPKPEPRSRSAERLPREDGFSSEDCAPSKPVRGVDSSPTRMDEFLCPDIVRTSTTDSVDLARMAGARAATQCFPKRRGRRREPRQMSLRDIKAEKPKPEPRSRSAERLPREDGFSSEDCAPSKPVRGVDSSPTRMDEFLCPDIVRTSTTDSVDLARMAGVSASPQDEYSKSDLVRTSTTDSVDLARMAGTKTGPHRRPQRRGRRRYSTPGKVEDSIDSTPAKEDDFAEPTQVHSLSRSKMANAVSSASPDTAPRVPVRRSGFDEGAPLLVHDLGMGTAPHFDFPSDIAARDSDPLTNLIVGDGESVDLSTDCESLGSDDALDDVVGGVESPGGSSASSDSQSQIEQKDSIYLEEITGVEGGVGVSPISDDMVDTPFDLSLPAKEQPLGEIDCMEEMMTRTSLTSLVKSGKVLIEK